ncbi:MAG: T9SS type A sorting domain-containing protein [Roseivirga sp.]|nr:T9SS type A sorting domain-containing protein [Roseivirga sp.]
MHIFYNKEPVFRGDSSGKLFGLSFKPWSPLVKLVILMLFFAVTAHARAGNGFTEIIGETGKIISRPERNHLDLSNPSALPRATQVAIIGPLNIGKTLAGTYSYSDDDNDPESGTTYQWYRSDDIDGTGKVAVAGATALTYQLTINDLGKYFSFEVTPRSGGETGLAVESDLAGAVSAATDWDEITKITSSQRDEGQSFGSKVAIDGEYAIVGVYKEDSGNMEDAGAAYIYKRDADGNWSEFQRLVASDAEAGDQFGFSVAISGDFAMVGANLNFISPHLGVVYVFQRDTGTGIWSEVQQITGSIDPARLGRFGFSLSMNGDFAIVGSADGSGISGELGTAYIFGKQPDDTWMEVQRVDNPNGTNSRDRFGHTVAMGEGYAAVGAIFDDEDENEGATINNAGAAYIFKENTDKTWSFHQKVVASDRGNSDNFGIGMDMDGDVLMVGSHREQLDANGGDFKFAAGAVYVFNQNNDTWTEEVKLVSSDRNTTGFFGWSVSVDGDKAIIGSYGNQLDENAENLANTSPGAAFLFRKEASGWTEVKKMVAPSRRNERAEFGFSVAITGDHVIVGAPSEQYGASEADPLEDAGAIYFFGPAPTTTPQRAPSAGFVTFSGVLSEGKAATGSYRYFDADGDTESGSTYQWYRSDDATGRNKAAIAGATGISYLQTSADIGKYISFEVTPHDGNQAGVPKESPLRGEIAMRSDWDEFAKITASDRAAGDFFSADLDMDGGYAVVASITEEEDENGQNTVQDAGSVYIFKEENEGNWEEVQKIVASDRSAGARFGTSVGISGDYIVVGAPSANGFVNGQNTTVRAGAAYIYEKAPDGTWSEKKKIGASDGTQSSGFGNEVAISGDYIVVSAYVDDTDENGQGNIRNAGSAYIFEKAPDGSWAQVQKIVSPVQTIEDRFGSGVAIDGDYAAISAYGEDEDANEANTILSAGAVYVYKREASGTWIFSQKLVHADRDEADLLGHQLAMSGNLIIASAHFESEDENGANTINRSGSAYIFERAVDDTWSQVAKLVASDRGEEETFGLGVEIKGSFAAIGSPINETDANGTKEITQAGAVYLFEQAADGSWSQVRKIVPSDRSLSDQFGRDISIDGPNMLIGAQNQRTDLRGENPLSLAGAAYFFGPSEALFSLASGIKDSDTKLTASFTANVRTNGGNPGDFVVKDALGTDFAVTAQADGTAGDTDIVLTVSDLGTAIGDLNLSYLNNNNEITDFATGVDIATSNAAGVIVDADTDAPVIVGAKRNTNTQITVTFDDVVRTQGGNPGDFTLVDEAGTNYGVTQQADGTTEDRQIVLTVADISDAEGDLTLTYINTNAEISDFGGNDLATDATGVIVLLPPKMTLATPVGTNQILVSFTLNVQTNGGNPTDFTVTDGCGNDYPVSAQADVTSGDTDILLTVADFSMAVGDLQVTYTNNNNEVADFDTGLDAVLTDNEGVVVDLDQTAPVMLSALKSSDTEITLVLSEPVQLLIHNSGDFRLKYQFSQTLVTPIAIDNVAKDNLLTLTVNGGIRSDLGIVTITYGNYRGGIFDFGHNDLATDDVGVEVEEELALQYARWDGNTEITLLFNLPVRTHAGNPGDFVLADEMGTTYNIISQADGTAGDNQLVLATADLSGAVGELSLTYTNNNDEVSDFVSGSLLLETTDTPVPVLPFLQINGAIQYTDTQVILDMSETVSINGLDPSDFNITDDAGIVYAVATAVLSEEDDSIIELETADLSMATGNLTLTYANSADAIVSLPGEVLEADLTGRLIQRIWFKQSFESAFSDNWNFLSDPVTYNSDGSLDVDGSPVDGVGDFVWAKANSYRDITAGAEGAFFWLAHDLADNHFGRSSRIENEGFHALTFEAIDVTDLDQLRLSFQFNRQDQNSHNANLGYEVIYDHASDFSPLVVTGNVLPDNAESLGNSRREWEEVVLSVPEGTQFVRLRLLATSSVRMGYDDIRLNATLKPTSDVLAGAVKNSNTQVTLSFSQNVQTNGGNPGDFSVTDGLGNDFAVTAQADGTAGDTDIVLTVANLSTAIGDLRVQYTNNNNEISDAATGSVAVPSDPYGVVIDTDNVAPAMISAERLEYHKVTVTFNEPVQLGDDTAANFVVTDSQGDNFEVTALEDVIPGDNEIVLTVHGLRIAEGTVTLTYVNNTELVKDFGGNPLLSDAIGIPMIQSVPETNRLTGNMKWTYQGGGSFIDPPGTNSGGLELLTMPTLYGVVNNVTLGDIDGDGDVDFLSTGISGKLIYYENKGTADTPLWEQSVLPALEALVGTHEPFLSNRTRPNFIDLDADGDLDLILGSTFNFGHTQANSNLTDVFTYLKNTGSATNPVFTLVDNSTIGLKNVETIVIDNREFQDERNLRSPSTAFADLDNDGDQDLILSFHRFVVLFTNVGTATNPDFQIEPQATDPFYKFEGFHDRLTGADTPVFEDFDQDGDYDMYFQNIKGIVKVLENVGTPTAAEFSDVLADVAYPLGVQSHSNRTRGSIDFEDINGDGIKDVMLASYQPGEWFWYLGEMSIPEMVSAVVNSNTEIVVSFSQNVQTNGGNPTDFVVTDALGNTFAVAAQSDGIAGDTDIVLTVTDFSNAIGDLTITYTNNNNEISDTSTGSSFVETDAVGVTADFDNSAPTMLSAVKNSDTQITVTFSELVQTNETNPTDFTIVDDNNTPFTVSAQADGIAGDNQIVLTVADLSTAVTQLTISYTNNNNEISDFGGNNLTTDGTGVVILLDVIPPDVTLTTMANDPHSGVFDITVTFTEDVMNIATGDFIVTNGSATAISGSGGVYVVTITPAADGTVTVNLPANSVQDLAGNDNTASNTITLENDETAPTVTITSIASDPIAGAFDITITFSEAVTGFDGSDISVGNGVTGNFAGSGTSYTATITPSADGAVTVDINTGAAEDTAGNDNAAATQFSIENDETDPTVTISTTAGDPVSGAFTASFTFDEAVTDFTLGDISVGNGTASSFAGSGTSYTVTITPSADGTVTVDVPANVAQDGAGNDNTAATQLSIENDEIAPTVTITSTANDPINGVFDITLTFSEDITGLGLADLTLLNSTAANLSGSGAVYTVTVTPTGDGAVTIDLAAASAQDAAGNDNTAAAQFSIQADLTAPATPVITSMSDDTGSDSADNITSDNTLIFAGTAEANSTVEVFIDGSSIGTTTTDGSGGWSYNHSATTLADASYSITANATDAATNTSTLSTVLALTVDTVTPVDPVLSGISDDNGISSTDIITNDPTLIYTGTAEPFATIIVGAGPFTLQTTTADANGDWTADVTFRPFSSSITIFITATDAAGNASPNTNTFLITIDTVVPTVQSITRADPNPTAASSVDYTVTFSEEVHGLSTSNFSLALTDTQSANVASVSASSGTSITVTVDNITGEGSFGLILSDISGITDVAGNVLGATFTGEVYNTNFTPTDISLSASSILENNAIGDVVAMLSSTDDDAGDTHTYSLVAGTGDTDNASFTIAGDELKAAEAFDLETKASYNIRIQTDDGRGGTFEKAFTITIDNVAEADLRITGNNDIPATPLGITTTFDIIIHNDGDATLNVSSILYPTAFGGPVSGITVAPASSQTVTLNFTPTVAQVYTGDVTIITNGGTGILTVTADGAIITSVDNGLLKAESINVYPNPATDIVTIDLSKYNGRALDIQLYDMSGIKTFDISQYKEPTLKLDVSQYHNGLYLVQFTDGSSTVQKKIMIRK